MKKIFKISLLLVLVSTTPLLGACSRTYEPGTVTPKRVQVEEDSRFEQYSLSELDDRAIDALALDYNRQGSSAMDMTVTYDPKSRTNTAMKATHEAARLSKALASRGVSIKSNILPVAESGEIGVLVSYGGYNALAPDCELMSGIEDRDHRTDLDYKMGCSVETMIARQVARPNDLLGRAPSSVYKDGRGISNQIEGYRTGAQNEPLGGETASE